MPENFKDIPFNDAKTAKTAEEIDKLLQEHLKVSLVVCTEALATSLQERAEEIADELTTVAPHGDYGKLLESPKDIADFLRDEASKPEYWSLEFLEVKKEKDQLLKLVFTNKAVDDGFIMNGFVFLGLSGKIRHAFIQVNG